MTLQSNPSNFGSSHLAACERKSKGYLGTDIQV